jgi:glutamate--cysteine ligase
VVKEGRKPGLQLDREGKAVELAQWGRELLDQIAPYAALYDAALGGSAYADSLAAQRAKLGRPDDTPSARLLAALTDSGESFHDYSLHQSREHAQALRAEPLPADVAAEYRQAALDSSAEQRRIEQSDDVDFDTYVARYHAALKAPRK